VLPGNTSKLPLYSDVHAGLLDHRIETQNLNAFKAAISVLKDIPTARLERAFISHLDSLIYRLDSWQTSLFDLKLQQKRNLTSSHQQRTLGVYLGAFGYLENVKRASNRRVQIGEDVLPEIMRKPKADNLFVEPANGGFFQTPSLSHASAAAMLRNGYLTYSNSTEPNLMSVNLSSERVRRALFLLEGVRNGQRLEALLGYQFERGLHDAFSNDGINLNPYLPLFRTAFPIRSNSHTQSWRLRSSARDCRRFFRRERRHVGQSRSRIPVWHTRTHCLIRN